MMMRRVWLWCIAPLVLLAWLLSGLSLFDTKSRTTPPQSAGATNITWCTALPRDGMDALLASPSAFVVNATRLRDAPTAVRNPGDSANFSCLLRPQHRQDALYGNEERDDGRGTRGQAAGREAWFVMLGEAALARQAPLTSRAALFFRNSSHSYQRWHGRVARSAPLVHRLFARQGSTPRAGDEATPAAAQKAALYVVPLYDYADHSQQPHSPSLAYARALQRESGSRVLRLAANVLPAQSWSCCHRLRELAHTVLHYPWYNPMALARLFYVRQLRLRFLVDRWTTLNDGTSLLFEEEEEEEDTADDVGAMLDRGAAREVHQHGRAFALAEGLIRRLRIVSFPPTPLRLERVLSGPPPPTWQSTSEDSSNNNNNDDDETLSPPPAVRVETRLVCDFRTVLDARAHIHESASHDTAARRHASPFASAAASTTTIKASLLSLHDEDEEHAYARGAAPASRGALGWLSYVLSYLFRHLTLPLHRLTTAAVHDTDYTRTRTHYSGANTNAAAPTPSQRLARQYLGLVREELGPRQAARSVVPEWLRQLLGRQVLVSRRSLVERRQEQERRITEDIHPDAAATVEGGDVRPAPRTQVTALRVTTTEYWFHFTTTLPATRTMCLGLEALPRPRRQSAAAATGRKTSAGQADRGMAAQYAEAALKEDGDAEQGEEGGAAHAAAGSKPPASATLDMDALQLHVEEYLSFDTVWLKLMLLACALLLVQPYVECSRLAHFCVAALCGVVVLLVFLLLYVSRELRNMTVGKAGLLVVLAVGGVAAATEGLLSAGAHVLRNMDPARQAEWYMYGTLLLVLLGAVSSVAIHMLLPAATLRRATRWGFAGLMIAMLMLAWARNREATVLAGLLYAVARSRYGLSWLLTLLFANIRPQSAAGNPSCCLTDAERAAAAECSVASWQRAQEAPRVVYDLGAGGGVELNEPQEQLPAEARRTVAYATPLVAEAYDYAAAAPREGSYGKTPSNRARLSRLTHAQKMRKFESDGAEFTRRALEQLAQRVREQPGQYATRLRDPNGLQRWAGMQDDDASDDSNNSSSSSSGNE